ncbi:unnamed protein product [Parascedosporium putredinis]|uniref:Spt3 n=1 Tax=Parascedosporium putredinis TaxID=1442378 RepID=A0A9P1GVB2_9PEZI|nr:unnamed protein product [Parascedosporium putredinis]CAI7987773.1 unnamed protein product [Parascedosporium putredinis]
MPSSDNLLIHPQSPPPEMSVGSIGKFKREKKSSRYFDIKSETGKTRMRIVQGTDTDAAVSRQSAVDLGYLEDPFTRFFVQDSHGPGGGRRLPIINRGTYTRTMAVDTLIDSFLRPDNPDEAPRQIVSLGAVRPDDAFGKMMVSNLAARRIRMPTLERYREPGDQLKRLKDAGFSTVKILTVHDIFESWIPREEKARLDALEGQIVLGLSEHFAGHVVVSPVSPMFEDGEETEQRLRARLTWVLQQMMYVSGETAEPSVETTGIIEDIVRQQVIELLRNCTELAARRGSRSIGINDLIFQIRHDQAKVSRLRTFLSWKDVRKNVKDSDDKGGDADLGAAEDPSGGVPGGPVDDSTKKIKTTKTTLPWEPTSFYNQEVPERDDEEDEEEEAMNHITLQRLQRQTSGPREWAGFGIVTDSKPSDDIVDILGFLTFEMVQTLTEVALSVKEQEDFLHRAQSGVEKATGGAKKRKLNQGLFDPRARADRPSSPATSQRHLDACSSAPRSQGPCLTAQDSPITLLSIFFNAHN